MDKLLGPKISSFRDQAGTRGGGERGRGGRGRGRGRGGRVKDDEDRSPNKIDIKS